MAELEIHHEAAKEVDPTSRMVGLLAALLAVALAGVTIASHRSHTAAIINKSTANDDWAHYQATRVKYHNLELGENLLQAFGGNSSLAPRMLADYARQKKDYAARAKQIQQEAERAGQAAEASEHRGLRYDVGEGLLEIGLVLTSLFFISRRKMFPVLGVISGVAGIAIGITGLLI